MQRYANRGGNSNVSGFEISDNSITVWFKRTARSYTYSYTSAGSHNVERMKKLASTGSGLNSYIKTNVKIKYVK